MTTSKFKRSVAELNSREEGENLVLVELPADVDAALRHPKEVEYQICWDCDPVAVFLVKTK